jgi:hypothetical protein
MTIPIIVGNGRQFCSISATNLPKVVVAISAGNSNTLKIKEKKFLARGLLYAV